MTLLAVTGHRGLPEATAELVRAALEAEIGNHAKADLVGSLGVGSSTAILTRRLLRGGGSW